MEHVISKLGAWWYSRKQRNYERLYEQLQDYIDEHGYTVDKKALFQELGYIYIKDSFSVESQEENFARKITEYRKKKQKFRDGDYTIRGIFRPRPGHVTQTNTNIMKIMGFGMGSVLVGGVFGEITGFRSAGLMIGFAGFFYGTAIYAKKVTNEGKCDLCGKDISTNQSLYLEGEKREDIAEYVLCDSCYEEKKPEAIDYEDMRWNWRKFRLVES